MEAAPMSKLIYFMPMSLDGFIVDESNNDKNWSPLGEEASALINELHRSIGTYLYGRNNYEMMTVWQTPDAMPDLSPTMTDFAPIWQAANKIVYSKSLATVSTPKTRLEREFDPQAVRDLKAHSPHDMSVAGPNLAAQAIRAGLVDECHLLVIPLIVGGGKQVLPGNVSVKLELLDERRIDKGWVYLRYRTHI
jgi:dihydrofolate reductase